MPIIRVALDVPLSTLFDYIVSAEMRIEIGQRVRVPFGRKQLLGIAMEWQRTRILMPDASNL